MRRCSASNPSTASRPFVVPDSARIASAACVSLASDGRPAATPLTTEPFTPRRYSTSASGWVVTPLIVRPTVSTIGPSARHLLRDRRVVTFDHDQPRHGLTRNRFALTGFPVQHPSAGLSGGVGAIMQQRHRDDVLAFAEVLLSQPGETARDPVKRLEVGLGLPRRRDRRGERMHERVHVGAGQVVLLVPGGCRAARHRRTAWCWCCESPATAAGPASRSVPRRASAPPAGARIVVARVNVGIRAETGV